MTTLFRLASVSKHFAWTAVMQLVEAGKFELDAAVNQYLDVSYTGTCQILQKCLSTLLRDPAARGISRADAASAQL